MEEKPRSADEMVRLVVTDPERLKALKENPLPELEKPRAEAVKTVPAGYIGDQLIYRIAVIVLGSL